MGSFSGGGAIQWAAITVDVLCIDAMDSFSGGGAMQWALGNYGGGGAMQGEDSMEIERPVGEGLCSRWG